MEQARLAGVSKFCYRRRNLLAPEVRIFSRSEPS